MEILKLRKNSNMRWQIKCKILVIAVGYYNDTDSYNKFIFMTLEMCHTLWTMTYSLLFYFDKFVFVYCTCSWYVWNVVYIAYNNIICNINLSHSFIYFSDPPKAIQLIVLMQLRCTAQKEKQTKLNARYLIFIVAYTFYCEYFTVYLYYSYVYMLIWTFLLYLSWYYTLIGLQ